MTDKLNQIEPGTHFLALAIILIVAGFFAFLFAGAVLHERIAKAAEEEDPAEVDPTYYPDTGEDLDR